MTALGFLVGIAVLFAAVLAWEAEPEDRTRALRPAGLWRWLVSGNWPAKVGAGLLVIGSGALIRYLMLNLDFPDSSKLLAGVVFSVLFGMGSSLLKTNPKRRAIHLALGGAALGTAYLTAYSAYGFFHFVNDSQALGLLFLVAIGATIFAITTRALSIALLTMVGAYIAPAFALESPGPVPVYGYYLLASLLTLVMVWQRGWRPLIHLSFLFTLAGALFFGWTQKFYTPQFYAQMQPLLLALVAIHLGMPLLERRDAEAAKQGGLWPQRFDVGYFLLLPLVASILTLLIAPDTDHDGVLGFLALAALWLAAAVVQHRRFKEGALRYAGVALILLLLTALLALGQVSFFLIGAVTACLLLAFGPRVGVPAQLDGLLVTVALAGSACYLLQALFMPITETPFLNAPLARHTVLAAALAIAGFGMRKRGQNMALVFTTLAIAWLAIVFAREFIRMYVGSLAQAFHLLILATAVVYTIWLNWKTPKLSIVLLLGAALFYTGLFGAGQFPAAAILPLMLAGQVIFSVLAYRAGSHAEEGELLSGVARSLLPLLMFPWALAYSHGTGGSQAEVVMVLLVCSALFASLQAQFMLPQGRYWPNALSPVGFVIFGAWLFYQSLFHIERNAWAVAYELIALGYLVQTTRFLLAAKSRDARYFSVAAILAVTSVAAAMVLRLVGPPGTLTIMALHGMLLPAVVSLFWAVIGGVLTWWATRRQSRGLWSLGALLLVAAAIKLVLFDFGSLGQLGNILAMMAAGGVFLLVAWLAPFPPKAEQKHGDEIMHPLESLTTSEEPHSRMVSVNSTATATASPQPIRAEEIENEVSTGRGWVWIVAGIVIVGLFLYGMGHRVSNQVTPLPQPQENFDSTAISEHSTATTVDDKKITASESHIRADTPSLAESVLTASELSKNSTSTDQATPSTTAPERPPMDTSKLEPFQFDNSDSKTTNPSICGFPNLVFPEDFVVFAAGGYSGKETRFQIDQSGHQATQIDVAVHYPEKPVVLMLGAYEPTIWNIGWSPQTHILAVIVSGYHRQAVAGLDNSVPVLNSSYDNKGACGYFYVSTGTNNTLNLLSKRLFGKYVDMLYPATAGRVLIGENMPTGVQLVSSNETTPESYHNKAAPLAGQAGLDDAVAQGILRPATPADVKRWQEAEAKSKGTPLPPVAGTPRPSDRSYHMFGGYVVLKPFTFPAGLYGAHSATFFVLEGVPPPRGNPGHSAIYNFNTITCQGALCGHLGEN